MEKKTTNNGGQKKNGEKTGEKPSEKTEGTQQKNNNTEGGGPKKKGPPKIDVSLLQQPMQVSMRGVNMILKCMEDGTKEMKDLLMKECDVIFECKVCRSMFRGLPNLLSHKRSFCIKQYVDQRTEFPRENPSDTCYVKPTEPDPQYAEPEDEVTVAEVRARRGRMRDPILFALSKNLVEPKNPPPGPLPLNSIIDTLPENVKISTDLSPGKLQQLNSSSLSVELSPLKTHMKQLISPTLTSMAKVVDSLPSYPGAVKRENDAEDDSSSSSSSSLETSMDSLNKSHNTQMDMLRSMKNVDLERNRCLQCRKSFLQWQYLLSHMRTKHAAERKLYKCTLCETVFQYTRSIGRHLARRHKKSHKEIAELVNKIRESPIMVKSENALKAVKANKQNHKGKTAPGNGGVFKSSFSLITCRMCNKVFGKKSTRDNHEKGCYKRISGNIGNNGNNGVGPHVVKRGRGRPRKNPPVVVTPEVNGPVVVNGTSPTNQKPASPTQVNGTPNRRKSAAPCKVIQNVDESYDSSSDNENDDIDDMINGTPTYDPQPVNPKRGRGRPPNINRQPSSKSGSDGENVKTKIKSQKKAESPNLNLVSPQHIKKEGKASGKVKRTGYTEKFQDIAKPYMDSSGLKCLICGQLFLLRPTLITHVCSQHLQMRRFKCTLCNWKALFKSEVVIHLRHKHHQETGTKVKDKLMCFVEAL